MPEQAVQSISVVVPVYGSEKTIGALADRLALALPHLASSYEAIFVNDGSRDNSWTEIQRAASVHPWVRGICLMRNYGQHNALLCGIRAARNELVVTMDDDLQHPPEEIAKMLGCLGPEVDVVYGTPQVEQHGLWRDMASLVTKLVLQSVTGSEVARNMSAFRIFRTSLRDAFADYRSPQLSIDVLLTWGTTRFAATPVAHQPRKAGESNYTFTSLMSHAINMFTGYSTAPLRVAVVMATA